MKAIKNPFKNVLLVAVFLTCFFLGRPSLAGLSVTSESYPWWHDQWVPVGGDVSIGGSTKHTPSYFDSYGFGAGAYSQARMYCIGYDQLHWCHGAGGYRRWGWEVFLEVQGEPGEQADVFLNMGWLGYAWVEKTDVDYFWADAGAVASSTYYIKAAIKQWVILELSDSWQLDLTTEEGHDSEQGNFESYPDPFYLGRMTAGDIFSVSGYFEAYANAYVGEVYFNTTTQARMDTQFSFEVNANQVSESVPAPGAALLVMIGSGLFAASRRIIRS